jgi:hypothetical protein
LGSVVQSWPHAPQLRGSSGTQPPSHARLPLGQPASGGEPESAFVFIASASACASARYAASPASAAPFASLCPTGLPSAPSPIAVASFDASEQLSAKGQSTSL